MPVTPEENEKYRRFVNEIAIEVGAFDFQPEQIVWHYTNGPGLLGILQSSTIYATQVSCLNDLRETRYATELYKDAVRALIKERADDELAVKFLEGVLVEATEDPNSPTHGSSKFLSPALAPMRTTLPDGTGTAAITGMQSASTLEVSGENLTVSFTASSMTGTNRFLP